MGSMLIVEIF